MKHSQFNKLIGTFMAAAFSLLLTASVTQANSLADTSMQGALLAAHFKVKPAVSAAQRHQLQNLPDHRFTKVQQGSETYYLFPDKAGGRLYAGDHWAYQAFMNNEKNNRLRRAGAFVYETDPSNRADNRRVVVWHDWSPFQEWR